MLFRSQPLVDTQARRVVSAEALLRWNSAEHGLQYPGTFMPILERGDHIVEVGAWVLHAACRAARAWPDVRVAVNLSARQFASRDLLATVRSALRESGLAADRLELEITESLMMLNPERTARILRALRADGVRVMLDAIYVGGVKDLRPIQPAEHPNVRAVVWNRAGGPAHRRWPPRLRRQLGQQQRHSDRAPQRICQPPAPH